MSGPSPEPVYVVPKASFVAFALTLLAGVLSHVPLLPALGRALLACGCFLLGGGAVEIGLHALLRAARQETRK